MPHLVIQIKTRAGLPDVVDYYSSDDVLPFMTADGLTQGMSQFVSMLSELADSWTPLSALHTFTEERGETSNEGYRTILSSLWRNTQGSIIPDSRLNAAVAFIEDATNHARARMPVRVG